MVAYIEPSFQGFTTKPQTFTANKPSAGMLSKQKHSSSLVDPEFQWKESKTTAFRAERWDFIFIGPFCDPVLQSMILEFIGSHINGAVGDGAALSGSL